MSLSPTLATALLPVLAVGLGACSSKQDIPLGTVSTFTSSSVNTDPSTTSANSVEDPTVSDPTSVTVLPPLADYLRIVGVEANQGVSIDIVAQGQAIAANERNAPLIAGRDLMIRISDLEIDESFEGRNVLARLELDTDGEVTTHDTTVEVSGYLNKDSLDGAIYWTIPAEAFHGATSFSIQLLNADEPVESQPAQNASRYPESGSHPLEPWDDPMEIDLTIVPVSCPGYPAPDYTQEQWEPLYNYLYNMFPVQQVNIEHHDPIESDCDLDQLVHKRLPVLKAEDGAPDSQYYGALLPGFLSGNFITTSTGLASQIETSHNKDHPRTFAAYEVWDVAAAFDIFAHELGHVHGRLHTHQDWNYPYHVESGTLCGERVTWGYGLRPGLMPPNHFAHQVVKPIDWREMQTILPPTEEICDNQETGNPGNYNDFMSYTSPYWVSDYTYKAMAERVRDVSSWKFEDAGPTPFPNARTVDGVIRENGSVVWGYHRGATDVLRKDTVAQCFDKGSLVAQFDVLISKQERDDFLLRDTSRRQTAQEIETTTHLSIPMLEGFVGDNCRVSLGKLETYEFDPRAL